MAFVKRTWKDRISEYPNRRIINDGYVSKPVTVSRDEGTVTEEGTPFNASNMNDLEARIEAAIESGGGGGGGGDSYTKAETDALLDFKADKSNTYTKTEIDGMLILDVTNVGV